MLPGMNARLGAISSSRQNGDETNGASRNEYMRRSAAKASSRPPPTPVNGFAFDQRSASDPPTGLERIKAAGTMTTGFSSDFSRVVRSDFRVSQA